MIWLSLLGIAAGVWLWNNVNNLLGLGVGLLFGGGLGWFMLGGVLARLSPNIRRHQAEFFAAWEPRFGRVSMGSRDDRPALAFRAWMRERRASEISAAAFLDQLIDDIDPPLPLQAEAQLVPVMDRQPGGRGRVGGDDEEIIIDLDGLVVRLRWKDLKEYRDQNVEGASDGLWLQFGPGSGSYALILSGSDLDGWRETASAAWRRATLDK